MPFDWLIWVGRRAERDLFTRPGRAIELTTKDLDEVALHQNDRREVVVGIHLELDVVASREAVVATMRTAAVRVQRPLKRHTVHAVQSRPASHFLVRRLV